MAAAASMGVVLAQVAQPPSAAAATVDLVLGWTPFTAYTRGEQVINSNNDVGSANVTHTSSATYAADTAKWDLSSTFVPAFVVDAATYGNGVTDATAHIQSKITAAGSNGVIEFPPGDYLITSGLTFVEGCVPHMRGRARLIYNGTGTAVTFYRWANVTHMFETVRVSVLKTAPAWWSTDTTSVGVLFANCYKMMVELPHVQGFNTGVSLVGDGSVGDGGTSCLDIRVGGIEQNKIGVAATIPNAGYVSAIQLNGGRIRLDNIGQSTNVGTRYLVGKFLLSNLFGVMLEGSYVEKAVESSGGGNVFMGCSFESVRAGGVAITGIGTHMFVGCGSLSHYTDPVLADGSMVVEVIGANGAHFVANNLVGKATMELINRYDGMAFQTRSADNSAKYVELVNANLNIYRGGSQSFPGITLTPNYSGPGTFGGLHLGRGDVAPDAWLCRHGLYPALITDVPMHAPTHYAGANTTSPKWTSGTGTPEGAVSAAIGSLFSRIDGGASTSLYVKQSGTGNVGWVAK